MGRSWRQWVQNVLAENFAPFLAYYAAENCSEYTFSFRIQPVFYEEHVGVLQKLVALWGKFRSFSLNESVHDLSDHLWIFDPETTYSHAVKRCCSSVCFFVGSEN